jgi:hypothetical protein
MNDNTKPIEVFRDEEDAAIAASVWLRQTRSGVFYDVSCARAWADSESGRTGYSQSFSDRHLDALIRVVAKARDYIADKKAHAVTVTGGEPA